MNIRYALVKFGSLALLFALVVIGAAVLEKKEALSAAGKASAVQKVAYLTFDDGPTSVTAEILDVLKQRGVKATFFVTAQYPEYLSLLDREAAEGHCIGIHTYTHVFADIYRSPSAFWEDHTRMRDIIFLHTFSLTYEFRFAGGSSNTLAPRGVMRQIISDSEQKGLRYHDWNVDSRDAIGSPPVSSIINNILRGVDRDLANGDPAVILMHDIPTSNARKALDTIITELANRGYIFDTVNNLETPVKHDLK